MYTEIKGLEFLKNPVNLPGTKNSIFILCGLIGEPIKMFALKWMGEFLKQY